MTHDEEQELRRRVAEKHTDPCLIEIPIRPGTAIKVSFPFNITPEEAGKVARVLMALAGKDEGETP